MRKETRCCSFPESPEAALFLVAGDSGNEQQRVSMLGLFRLKAFFRLIVGQGPNERPARQECRGRQPFAGARGVPVFPLFPRRRRRRTFRMEFDGLPGMRSKSTSTAISVRTPRRASMMIFISSSLTVQSLFLCIRHLLPSGWMIESLADLVTLDMALRNTV